MSEENSKASSNETVKKDILKCLKEDIKRFLNDPDITFYSFPSSLTKSERAFVHQKCHSLGIETKSVGSKNNRRLTITKNTTPIDAAPILAVSEEVEYAIDDLVKQNISYTNISIANKTPDFRVSPDLNFGRLSYGNLINVPPIKSNEYLNHRKSLPSWNCREEFLNKLNRSNVLILTSETGSGKTTQFPQFILEEYHANKQPCRIICCQPRRISAVSVSERVAKERGEKNGTTVGYQIKLESNMGPETALIYCTNGVLLRTLMKGYDSLKGVTHVILDEIHERDKLSDFLMICLRDSLPSYPHIKLILMSATMDVEHFRSYFTGALVMKIPGKMFPVQKYFLPEILQKLNYKTGESRASPNPGNSASNVVGEDSASYVNGEVLASSADSEVYLNGTNFEDEVGEDKGEVDEDLKQDMIAAIDECIAHGTEDAFAHMMHLIFSENAWIDQQNSNGYTALMAAVIYNQLEIIQQLLFMGANTELKSFDGNTVYDWAAYYNNIKVLSMLDYNKTRLNNTSPKITHSTQLIEICDHIYSLEVVDAVLVAKLIMYIHEKDPVGSILVFLPGYEDIINCQMALSEEDDFNESDFKIFMLHGSMQMTGQNEVFNVVKNKQKVILSTNIAETSITIDDIVYVIDSGKMKEKMFDSISGISSLQTTRISRSSADQRRGRVGRTRPGECYCLYTEETYESFLIHRIPEIMRVPLHELCLLTKILSPSNTSIATFLNKAIDPPSSRSVDAAIISLVSLGALDSRENLTPLGTHLLQLSVEPHLGKMLIYAIILKCLDPVLTIVAGLTYKDPFIIPMDNKKKAEVLKKRFAFEGPSMSDHMILLRVFQEWQKARSHGREYKFCSENFVSAASMDIIAVNRMQLLKQLRAVGFVSTRPSDSIQFLNVHSESWPMIKAALTAGLYPNVAFIDGKFISTKTEKKVFIHNYSCLRSHKLVGNKETDGLWILYEELHSLNQRSSIKFGTVVTALTVALMCKQDTFSTDQTPEKVSSTFKIDYWLNFQIPNVNIIKLRKMVETIVTKKILNPRSSNSAQENAILKGMMEILHMEDQKYNIRQLEGIGAPPMPHKTDKIGGRCYKNQYDRSRNDRWEAQGAQGRRKYVNTMEKSPRAFPGGFYYPGKTDEDHGEVFRRALLEMEQNEVKKEKKSNWREPHAENSKASCSLHSQSFRNNTEPTQTLPPRVNWRVRNNPELSAKVTTERSTNKKHQDPPLTNYVPNPHLGDELTIYRFFVVKPKTMKSIQISQVQGTWLFSPQMEKKLMYLPNKDVTVILFFSVQRTSAFQGVAKLITLNSITRNAHHHVKWLSTNNVPYESTSNFKNAFNKYQTVTMGDDGQEIDPETGHKMCQLFFVNSAESLSRRAILGCKR